MKGCVRRFRRQSKVGWKGEDTGLPECLWNNVLAGDETAVCRLQGDGGDRTMDHTIRRGPKGLRTKDVPSHSTDRTMGCNTRGRTNLSTPNSRMDSTKGRNTRGQTMNCPTICRIPMKDRTIRRPSRSRAIC